MEILRKLVNKLSKKDGSKKNLYQEEIAGGRSRRAGFLLIQTKRILSALAFDPVCKR